MFIQEMLKLRLINLQVFVLAVLCLIVLNPYFIWKYQAHFYGLHIFFASLIFFIIQREKIFTNRINVFVLFCMALYLALLGASLLALVGISFSIYLYLNLNDNKRYSLFNKFCLLYALVLIPGIILWLLHIFLQNTDLFKMGIVPIELIPDKAKFSYNEYYFEYPGAVILNYMAKNVMYRFMGPFDEPGVVGTISGLILCATDFKLKKITNIIIFFAGLISYSFAFYFLAIAFLVLTIVSNLKNSINKLIILLAVIFFGCIGEFNGIKILNRFKLNVEISQIEKIRFQGDNRENASFKIDFDRWANSKWKEKLFGLSETKSVGSSSWRKILIDSGLIGLMLFITILFVISKSNIKKMNFKVLVFLLLFLSSIYQRPNVINLTYMLIFSIGLSFHSDKKITETDEVFV